MRTPGKPTPATPGWRAALLVALLAGGCEAPEEHVSRLVLIGIDGGSWNLIDPLLESGELPHLAALRDRGITADLQTVEPVISPTVWTSIATGRTPEAHGMTTFFGNRRTIRVPTVWERLAAQGLKVGLYDYLMTWPPRNLPGGFVIPGWLRRDESVMPPDLFARLELPPFFYKVVDVGGPAAVVANLEREIAEKPRYFHRLWNELEPDLGAVTFYGLDAAGHNFYHTAFPDEVEAPIESDPRFDGILTRVLRQLDSAVGEIVSNLGEKDHVILVSDHGFRASPSVFRRWGYDPAWFFEKADIDPERDGISVINGFLALSFAVAPGPAEDREASLRRLSAAFASVRTPDGAPVFRVDVVHDPAAALSEKEIPDWQADIMKHQPPTYACLFASGIPEVMDAMWPDGILTARGEEVALRTLAAPHVFTGDHDPIGIFIAAGKALRHVPQRTQLSVLDIAPLLFYLLDQPIPRDLEGDLATEWFQDPYLKKHPPRWITAAETPHLPPESGTASEDSAEGEIKKRLRALGYME